MITHDKLVELLKQINEEASMGNDHLGLPSEKRDRILKERYKDALNIGLTVQDQWGNYIPISGLDSLNDGNGVYRLSLHDIEFARENFTNRGYFGVFIKLIQDNKEGLVVRQMSDIPFMQRFANSAKVKKRRTRDVGPKYYMIKDHMDKYFYWVPNMASYRIKQRKKIGVETLCNFHFSKEPYCITSTIHHGVWYVIFHCGMLYPKENFNVPDRYPLTINVKKTDAGLKINSYHRFVEL